MHTDVKQTILKAIKEDKLAIDEISVSNSAKLRLPCSYDLFLTRESDAKIAKLNSKSYDDLLDVKTKLEPWERALERADIVRYTPEDEKCDIKFQPEDKIFSNSAGAVREEATEQLFVKARLCNTWMVDSYIQSGSFGRGWNGIDVHSKKKVFIKTFRSYSDRPQRRNRSPGYDETAAARQEAAIRKEIEVLLHPKFRQMVDHPSVVSNSLCYGSVAVPSTGRKGDMFFIMTEDLCEGGELFNYLCPPEPPYVRSFSENSARRIFRQIAAGVAHLHSVGAYHRDLKLENLVVDAQFNVKIMDFGSMKFTDQMETVTGSDGEDKLVATTYTGVGTGGYKPFEAREQAGTGGYDPGSFDVWSCGIILFYLVCGDVVFSKLGGQLCFRFIELIITKKKFVDFMSKAGDIDPIENAPSHTKLWAYLEDGAHGFRGSDELKHLINLMLDLDPDNRITMERVQKHEWFDEPDASDEVYNGEMHSRPISQGNDQLLDLSRHVKTDEAAKEYAIKNIPTQGDGTPYHVAVHADEADISLTADGEVMFIVFFGQHQKIMVRWLNGTLADWLEFILGLKDNLGLTAAKNRELSGVIHEMAAGK